MILEKLRSATAAAHRALEEQVDIAGIVQEPARYRHLLERFFGFHAAMEDREQSLSGWERTGYDPTRRLKSPWLAEDLHSIGLSATEIAALPRCTDLPPMPSIAAGLGCAYVLEGSTLGGRHISRFFAEGPAAHLPRRFFAGYGEETGARWREFIQVLEDYAATHSAAHDEIVTAARETFAAFERWMRP
jgi:heme oxygenase (biliverdin-IX-beta and delta-forming)